MVSTLNKNNFLNNKNIERLIKPHDRFTLAKNIENVWTVSKFDFSQYSYSIYNMRDFNEWLFNSKEIRTQYPYTSIDIKSCFGFYSSSSVCLPDFIQNLL